MDLPDAGYWHCKVLINNSGWDINALDMTRQDIFSSIVRPYRANKEFIVNGKRIPSREVINTIRIVHTEKLHIHYGTESWSSSHVYSMAPDRILAFDKGKDFTSYLLYSEKFDADFKEIDSLMQYPNQVINISQAASQHQSSVVNISIQFSQIAHLQELFDEFRLNLHGLDDVEEKRLKEAQESLDSLSQKSSAEQTCKALNKIQRIIKKASDVGSKLGKVVGGTASFVQNLETLRSAYNSLAPTFGMEKL